MADPEGVVGTWVIDPEFAFYGPMGFDVGALLANLLLAYFATDGLEEEAGGRDGQRAWLLETSRGVWDGFAAKLKARWTASAAASASASAASEAALALHQDGFVASVWADALGFAGAKMIRRIVGIAHVEDLEAIADLPKRAGCERRALKLARRMVVEAAGGFRGPGELVAAAEALRRE